MKFATFLPSALFLPVTLVVLGVRFGASTIAARLPWFLSLFLSACALPVLAIGLVAGRFPIVDFLPFLVARALSIPVVGSVALRRRVARARPAVFRPVPGGGRRRRREKRRCRRGRRPRSRRADGRLARARSPPAVALPSFAVASSRPPFPLPVGRVPALGARVAGGYAPPFPLGAPLVALAAAFVAAAVVQGPVRSIQRATGGCGNASPRLGGRKRRGVHLSSRDSPGLGLGAAAATKMVCHLTGTGGEIRGEISFLPVCGNTRKTRFQTCIFNSSGRHKMTMDDSDFTFKNSTVAD